MKKLAFVFVLCAAGWSVSAQLTPEQVAEKMRPEYRVNLPAPGSETAPEAPVLTRESVQREIAGLEAQIQRIQAAINNYQRPDEGEPHGAATLAKYESALLQTQRSLELQRAILKKLK